MIAFFFTKVSKKEKLILLKNNYLALDFDNPYLIIDCLTKYQQMKYVKLTLKFIIGFIIICVLYFAISLMHGTINDYQPEEVIPLELNKNAQINITSDTLSFLIWNIGYGGLGEEANFFYDAGHFLTSGGKMVNSSKKDVEKNVTGTLNFLKSQPADFYLLQEVDKHSSRSYFINQYEQIGAIFPNYSTSLAINYKVKRVPIPIAEPFNVIGEVESGIASYSRFQPSSAERLQLPGSYGWPDKIFHLDRCLAVHRYPVNGKELIVINTHNSAFDKGGVMKKQEMKYLKAFILKEYEAGNYIVVGGDWNQSPPNFQVNKFRPNIEGGETYQMTISKDFLPPSWTWAYDKNTSTNRQLIEKYKGKNTFVALIDFFLISPNVKLLEVKGTDMDFEFSDHQPVKMKIVLQ